jgi:hypothetical protein
MFKSIIAITLCFIVSSFAGPQSVSLDKETLALFTQYPASDELNYIAHLHANHDGLTKAHLVLYSTWFSDGNPKVAIETKIKTDGDVYKVRSVFDWAHQAATTWRLSADELQTLLTSIKNLPDSESAPLDSVVVVTFERDGKWQTRLYDRRRPPESVVTIYKLAHSVMPAK